MGQAHESRIAHVDTGALSHDGGAGVALSGNLLYIAGGHGLAVFDLSDPALPKRIGDVHDTGVLRAYLSHNEEGDESGRLGAELALVGKFLFVAGNNGMTVFDVSDPTSPKRMGDIIDTGALSHSGDSALAINGNILYVAGGKGLAVFDISDPTSVTRLGEVIDTGALSYNGGASIALTNETNSASPIMYVGGGKGLAVFDISNPAAPNKIGDVIDTGCLASGHAGAEIALKDNLMYVAGGKGLGVFDISDPLKPARIGSVIDTDALSWDGDCSLAFMGCEDEKRQSTLVCAGGKGLRVLRIIDPREPVLVGDVIDTGALASGGGVQLVLNGPFLYAIGGKGLAVFDPVKAGIDVAA